MNQLINDEAVYRTAPATPGLLTTTSTTTRKPHILHTKLKMYKNQFSLFIPLALVSGEQKTLV